MRARTHMNTRTRGLRVCALGCGCGGGNGGGGVGGSLAMVTTLTMCAVVAYAHEDITVKFAGFVWLNPQGCLCVAPLSTRTCFARCVGEHPHHRHQSVSR